MDSCIAIIQARTASERLPSKVLRDLFGKPLIAHVIERLRLTNGIDRVVMAVPEEDEEILGEIAENCGAEIFCGPADDVLERFHMVTRVYDSPFIIRATGDNPLLDTEMLSKAIEEVKSGQWDMVGTEGLPLGSAAEVFPVGLLDLMRYAATEDYHREHVTAYLYEHENEFNVKRIKVPKRLHAPRLRLTVDTEDDFRLIRTVYDKLYIPGTIIDLGEVIEYLKDNTGLASINRHIVQRSFRSTGRKSAVA